MEKYTSNTRAIHFIQKDACIRLCDVCPSAHTPHTYHGGQFAGHGRGGCGGRRVRGIAALTVIAGSGANQKGPLL